MAREFSPVLVQVVLVSFQVQVLFPGLSLILFPVLVLMLFPVLFLILFPFPSLNLPLCFFLGLVWPVFGDLGKSLKNKSTS
jgi:hypothetical protein